VPTGVT